MGSFWEITLESTVEIQNFVVNQISYFVLKSYFTLFLFLISFSSFSQILNIERYRLEKDSSKNFLAKVTAGVNAYNRSAAAEDPVNLFGYKWDINTKIMDHFSFTNTFEFSYEDKPIVPITKFIFAFKSGISFDF